MEPRNASEYGIEGKRGGKHFKKLRYKRGLSNNYQNATCLFCRNGQANLKLHTETQGNQKTKTILKKN